VAAGLLERLNAQLVRHQFQLALRPGRPQASLPEHLAIVAAILARRPDEAEEAARRHLRSVISALRETGAGETLRETGAGERREAAR
jgi:DNA-binding FadR family transcriptional regulator